MCSFRKLLFSIVLREISTLWELAVVKRRLKYSSLMMPPQKNFLPHYLTMSSLPANGPHSEDQLLRDFSAASSDADFLANISSEQSVPLAESWSRLTDSLSQLPVSAVDEGFAVGVQAEIQSQQQSSGGVGSGEQQSYNFGRAVALLATSCAVMLVAATIVAYQANTQPSATSVAFHSHDPQRWEVVVVTVPDERMQLVTAELRDAVDQRGLEIHTVSEGKRSTEQKQPLEMLMASEASSVEFLEALSSGTVDVEAEWNPVRIAGFDRAELLSRFAESMQTPTQSDQFFGEVFVVLPKERSIQVTSVPSATIREDAGQQLAQHPEDAVVQPANSQAADSVDAQVAELLERKTDRPVLVIFRKRPAAGNDIQGGAGISVYGRDSV